MTFSKKNKLPIDIAALEAKWGRILLQYAQDVIFVLDVEGNIQYVNQAGAKMLHKDQSEIIGKSQTDLFPKESAAKHTASAKKVIASGQAEFFEDPLPTPTGTVHISTWLVPIKNETGKVYAVLGISRDETPIKRAEAELRVAKQELETKVRELEMMNKLMVGREIRISELKEENETLKKELNKAGKAKK